MVAFNYVAPFPYQLRTLTNITPFTYRDGATFLEILEELKAWLGTVMVPGMDDTFRSLLDDFQKGILNAEKSVNDAKDGWETEFAEFMADVADNVQALSKAGFITLLTTDADVEGALDIRTAELMGKTSAIRTEMNKKSDTGHSHSSATGSASGFMSVADKSKLDGATVSNVPSTIVMRNAEGQIALNAPSATGHAATKAYVDGKIDFSAGDGHPYRFLAGVIRNDGLPNYWEILPEASNHRGINIDGIDNFQDKIRVRYDNLNADTTISFMAVPDETLSKQGIILGTSVTSQYADISISQTSPAVSDYIYYDGTNWVSYDGVFTDITFGSGILYVNHSKIPQPAQYSMSLTPRGGIYDYTIGTGDAPTGTTSMKIEIRDKAGVFAPTPNTNMKFYLTRGGGTRDINPLKLDTTLYPLSNIWLFGIMGMD